MSTGIVFASTGGFKIARAVKTLQAMEPDEIDNIHVLLTTNARTYLDLGEPALDVKVKRTISTSFVNGSMNQAVAWMRELGYQDACVLHDDLVFSPLAEHRHSLSGWFDMDWITVSGVTFAHFECLTGDVDMRREPLRWDKEDLASEALWNELMTFDRLHNGSPVYPAGRDWFVRYEGADKVRPWNRLGPTGFVVPIALWERFGGFDERFGCFYDHDYPAHCFRNNLPPVYAVSNVPWLHLHNQSVNPWADPAMGIWGDSDGAFARKFGAKLTDFWHTNWEERWLAKEPFTLNQTSTP